MQFPGGLAASDPETSETELLGKGSGARWIPPSCLSPFTSGLQLPWAALRLFNCARKTWGEDEPGRTGTPAPGQLPQVVGDVQLPLCQQVHVSVNYT